VSKDRGRGSVEAALGRRPLRIGELMASTSHQVRNIAEGRDAVAEAAIDAEDQPVDVAQAARILELRNTLNTPYESTSSRLFGGTRMTRVGARSRTEGPPRRPGMRFRGRQRGTRRGLTSRKREFRCGDLTSQAVCTSRRWPWTPSRGRPVAEDTSMAARDPLS